MLSNDEDLMRMPSPPKTLPDASSAKFMAYLGMDTRQDKYKQLYREMKADAIQAHRRICSNRANLLPYLQNDPSIRSPFTVTQITEQALQYEALRIQTEAREDIKQIYDGVAQEEQDSGPSWAARWMLWNVFLRGGDADSPGERVSPSTWTLDPLVLEAEMERQVEWTKTATGRRSVLTNLDTHATASKAPENRSYWDPVRHA